MKPQVRSTRGSSRTSRALSALLLLLASSPRAHAAWPHDPAYGNVPLCVASGDQAAPVSVSDGAGGFIVVWTDARGANIDLYVQRIDATGSAQWTTNGVALCSAAGDQTVPAVVSDGAGGAIVTWADTRAGNGDVYAQRVNAGGVPQWAANGVALCAAAGEQVAPRIASDAASGAVVTWADSRAGNNDVYVQRVNAAGAVQWTANGVALCTVAGEQTVPVIAADGGGAIVAWADARGGTNDIYAQRVNAAGAPQWTADGAVVVAQTNNQSAPIIVSDGAGGAIVEWSDNRAGGLTYPFYVQRLNAAGAPQWTADGVNLSASGVGVRRSAIASDGSGGAFVSWETSVGGGGDVYAQHVASGGTLLWTTTGVVVCSAVSGQGAPAMVPDGTGGVIVAFVDARAGVGLGDIYAQRVNALGALQWGGNAVALCSAVGAQSVPTIASDGISGAIVAWVDPRSGLGNDVYAQRVERFGLIGTPEPVIASVLDIPNDQGGRVRLAWSASYLDLESSPDLAAYDIYHSVPPNQAQERVARGESRLVRLGEAPPEGSSGTLFTVAGAQLLAWEFVSTVAPVHFLGTYGSTQATTGDSIAALNPLTHFMVVARDATGAKYWLSTPVSGYSVDNLPPVVPAPFVANYSAGATHLHWSPNLEGDLAHYRLYRGNSAGFVPGPGNLVASPPDTGYSHAGAPGGYYKLSAVDAHGNESGFALLTPLGTSDAPDQGTPVEISFGRPAPNPAFSSVSVRLALPREARVTVAIHDVAGRQVRELISGRFPAGERQVSWDLRDSGGARVADGIYFAVMGVEGRTITRTVSVIR